MFSRVVFWGKYLKQNFNNGKEHSMHKASRSHNKTTDRRGFTLIELLVVIAIIAILAAILFPVFARARENARRTSCLSNMKQIGLGFMQYTQDYDEKLPRNEYAWSGTGLINWDEAIYPYVKSTQLFQCPSAVGASTAASTQYNQDATGTSLTGQWTGFPNRDYGMNGYLVPGLASTIGGALVDNNGFLALASIGNAAEVFLAGEARRSNLGGWYGSILYAHNSSTQITYGNDQGGVFGSIHLEGANWLYADGHAKWLKPNGITGPWNVATRRAPWLPN